MASDTPLSGKILVMDDEAYIRDVASLMLKRMGYAARFAKNGEEAVAVVQQAQDEGNPFDAVILDLTIPGGQGGQETLARLRAIDARIKAIATSGYSNDPIMIDPQQYGFAGRLTKPYQRVELERVLREVLEAGTAQQ